MWFPLTCLHQAKPQDTLDLCQLLNDDLAATVARHPKRFVGLGTLPMQAPELAVKELERCVKQLGFPGIQIGSHINEWDLNAQELFPIYAVSRRHSIRGHAARLDTALGADGRKINALHHFTGRDRERCLDMRDVEDRAPQKSGPFH